MVRKRDNIKALSKFTIPELEAEVSRRRNAARAWGYIIIMPEEDDDDKRPRFGIVTMEYWMEHKCLSDSHLGDAVSLPPGFDEVRESHFVYRNGDLKAATDILNNAGFILLGEW